MKRLVSAAVLLLLLIPASAFAAASMASPATARIGSRVTVRAAGLKPGRYTLELVFEAFPGGASPTNCVAKVGSATSVGGRVTITGTVPSRLACYQGVGAVEGHVAARPGNDYHLTLGVSFAPNGFSGRASFVTRKVRVML
jgi:hypothetical protein